jgi:hypothetical protein
MPLKIPTIDDRRYQELLDEALARIPLHNPEWTNFNKSDPGVTILEVCTFLTESLLYRANQIPERNRRKFLSLLGVPLRPASSARGLVTIANESGPLITLTLDADLEVRARQTPFHTTRALDVLPIEAHAFVKRERTAPPGAIEEYYRQLYASFVGDDPPARLRLYESVPFPQRDGAIDLGRDTLDGSLWIALVARPRDDRKDVGKAIAGKTLSLGIVPEVTEAGRHLAPGGSPSPEGLRVLEYQSPKAPPGGRLPPTRRDRIAQYQALPASVTTDVLSQPGVVQLTLPGDRELFVWDDLDPIEHGTGDFPPSLEDTDLAGRVVTWVRIRATGAGQARLLWAGINTVFVEQRTHVANEVLPDGTGEPDQSVTLSARPVVPDSVRVTVITPERSEEWKAINDLLAAGPEVPTADPVEPPGTRPPKRRPSLVFAVDYESGEIRFGDGTRGARPPFGARIRADYDADVGRAGNVGPRTIDSAPELPPGFAVTNPVATWGGADAETESDGEKQITRYLQHRDRLVNAADFETIAKGTPGVEVGRVEVLPAFSPELSLNEPGDAPGAVTLMVMPSSDAAHPDAPVADQRFLDAICDHLEPRRLVTTELYVRRPTYKPIWVSVGLEVVAGAAIPEVREAVIRRLRRFLAPLPQERAAAPGDDDVSLFGAEPDEPGRDGWPLRKPVVALELLAQASRAGGVRFVSEVLLAEGAKSAEPQIPMTGLELPQIAGISVAIGNAVPLDELRCATPPPPDEGGPLVVPVPVVPETCK